MIYELQAPLQIAPFPDIFAGLPSRWLGLFLWLLGSSLALLWAYFLSRRAPQQLPRVRLSLPLAGLIAAGLFTACYTVVDEVSINLEHSYNLFHHGKFSMSPLAMQDGTVEALFYLLHTPFSRTPDSLVVANFIISLIVALLHLPLAVWALKLKEETPRRVLLLATVASSVPLAITFSSGFGNGLVSLLLLAVIGALVNEKTGLSLILSGLFPLFRPDAILLSFLNLAVVGVRNWIDGKQFRTGMIAVSTALTGVSAFAYYLFYQLSYGHWIPTPVFFKKVSPAMLQITNVAAVAAEILRFFLNWQHAAVLVFVLYVVLQWKWFAARVKEGAEGERQVLTLALYALATVPIFIFYSVTRHTLQDFSFQTYQRYWVAFDITILLLLVAGLAILSDWLTPLLKNSRMMFSIDVPAVSLFLMTMLLGLGTVADNKVMLTPRGRYENVFAGSFTQRYVPEQLTIATSEMNTFGLMLERPVIDLWGYTTPEIAKSTVCNGDRVRFNPNYFMGVKPDIFWPYWFSNGALAAPDYDEVEKSLALFHHTSKEGNRLGPMPAVLSEYDLIMVHTQWNSLAYLIRNKSAEELVDTLQAQGFRLVRSRKYDMSKFQSQYDKVKPLSYVCR